MRFQSYFNTAIKIIQLYDGKIPLHHFLKQYFSQHKKHGSTDRKFIINICYNFFRLGKSFTEKSIEEKLKIAIFICNKKNNEWSFLYDEDWLNNQSDSLQQRLRFIQSKLKSFLLIDIFPFIDEVSKDVDTSSFAESFFIQPDVFIRIRPGCTETIFHAFTQHKIDFNYVDESCVALFPNIKIDSIINIDEDAVIQDYSSQKVKTFLEIILSKVKDRKPEMNVWDCCAGSGGKSILAYDTLHHIHLTVSDVRASIIQNLKQRFTKAGIKNYKSFVTDVSNAKFRNQISNFDLIICDAPCTGSGTWSRTPEQLYFFQKEKINEYALLQKNIINNTTTALSNNGFFLYITCSVFKEENEANVELMQEKYNLTLLKMELLKGYDKKADTLFAALLQKQF